MRVTVQQAQAWQPLGATHKIMHPACSGMLNRMTFFVRDPQGLQGLAILTVTVVCIFMHSVAANPL